MEVVPVTGVKATEDLGGVESQKKNRIQVSNTKKPLFFYVNLAKKFIQQHDEIELSALGMAITTVVTIAEILKNNGLAVEKKVLTSTVDMKDETKGRLVHKAKIEIVLGRTEKFNNLMTLTTTTNCTEQEVTTTCAEQEVATTCAEQEVTTTCAEQEVTANDDLITASTTTTTTAEEAASDEKKE